MLKDQYPRPDHGNSDYGFSSFYEAKVCIVDQDNPCIGDTFKIQGKIYQLREIFGKVQFKRVE